MSLELATARARPAASLKGLWLSHALWPALTYLAVAGLIHGFNLDVWLAQTLFYDPVQQQWLGAGSGHWWAQTLIHGGGRNLIRALGAAALLTWLWTWGNGQRIRWRARSAYVLVSIIATVMLVAALKAVTNVDCPWNLAMFGGTRPYIDLLSARPEMLPHAACFPGGHSSSGFALVCFYFACKDAAPRFARPALVVALCIGALFAFGQEARGAHFLTHDLTSAFIAWCVALLLYRLMLR